MYKERARSGKSHGIEWSSREHKRNGTLGTNKRGSPSARHFRRRIHDEAGVHQLTPRLHLHLIQTYALVHAAEFQCFSRTAAACRDSRFTLQLSPFSNQPHSSPIPKSTSALSPPISCPKQRLVPATHTACISGPALKRNCIQPQRISARVTLPRARRQPTAPELWYPRSSLLRSVS